MVFIESRAVKRIVVHFYRTDRGKEPVREWLRNFDDDDRKTIGDDLQTLEFGWPVGMPVCRPVTNYKGLWEVRSRLKAGKIARVLFVIKAGKMILLHGFIKKSQKTPRGDLRLAAKRMKGKNDDKK